MEQVPVFNSQTRMIWLRANIVMIALMVTTCVSEDRYSLAILEGQMTLMKAFQSNVEVRLDAIQGDLGTLTKRVSNLESLVTTLENKVEELIGRTTEVYGIINEQSSTIKDGIMVTIRGLHISWSDWSAWSDCSQSCDRGRISRHRLCNVPPPLTDGICIGGDTETEECVIREFCPFDGQWALWSTWSTCSGSCGDGVETRNRSCSDPAPAYGGNVCPGHDIETNPCNLQQSVKYDCSDVLKLGLSRGSGVYRITPWNTHKEVDVYCDMDTDGGGWTVFQRRFDGSIEFNRSFVEYEQGFGSLDGEFWMGLGLLYSITSRAKMTLRMDMNSSKGTTGFDEYSGFYISPPDQYNFNVDRRINSAGSTLIIEVDRRMW
ncbi:semaphorin-5A-like isoform X1 [Mya arenaria]|uniref:semaphorin-5A-like isoform X1 n=3 Tax=Mya arenaria TaxID=6604 RepID=UPI0022E27F2B|nr:semaphorin-5A-like isoform X1 [Mya arenaria]